MHPLDLSNPASSQYSDPTQIVRSEEIELHASYAKG